MTSDALAAAPAGVRLHLAQRAARLGIFGLGACAVLPSGLLPFGLCLLAGTLLVPDLIWKARAELGGPLRACILLAVIVIALWGLSVVVFDLPLRNLDNAMRFVVLPWAALWAFLLRPSLTWLWSGALTGLVAAAVVAGVEAAGGAARANGWANAIVFADVVLLLCVLAVACRPAGHRGWWGALAGLLLGCVAILLSGSRGAWLGMLPVLVVLALSARWGSVRSRLFVLLAICLAAVVLVSTVPALNEQVRITEFRNDVGRMEHGDTDSSVGVRLERFELAVQAFADNPVFGVGVGSFDEKVVARLPACQTKWQARCHMGHAHNDLAEWAATMGVPGILVLLSIYGIPLLVFIRLTRQPAGTGRELRGAAWAGVMLVSAFALCGMTQSMFAHQLTSGAYAAMVGVLMGLATADWNAARRHALRNAADQAPPLHA